ncbi:MAG TPA: metallopeptidase family protein [Verrucomicrobiae bacterium]|nr:metallopeptidase family protein [Verrucomicrobiae bacterium]
MENHLGITDEAFGAIVAEAIDALPEKYGRRLDNVAFVTADQPSPQQREKMRLRHYETLFGLYEGIPQVTRGAGYSFVLPDKITIFKLPLIAASRTVEELRERTRKTVWHEVAHHFGLDHEQIDRLGGS